MTLPQATRKALAAFFRLMDGTASYQRAEAGLTLHMLEFLAPKFFAEEKLGMARDTALEALKKISSTFGPKIGPDEAMARLDGLYLRQIRGLKPRAFDKKQLKAAVKRADDQAGLLPSWLMGELALPLGVAAQVALPTRWPFNYNRVLHLYHLTHIVLVDTAYLRDPVPKALIDELIALHEALEGLERQESWDLLGECVFCLNRAGTPTPRAVEALLRAQQPDGSFRENDSDARSAAHCTAVGLLALAGALDLQRSAP